MVARKTRFGLTAALAFLLAYWTAPAAAQSADAANRSRKHYAAGRALYDLGNYEDALREFTAGYELLPRPLFLLDIGQCQRKLHDYDKARASFTEFLERAPANEPARPRAQALLQQVEREQAAEPPKPPPPEKPAPIAPPPTGVTVAPAPSATTVAPPPAAPEVTAPAPVAIVAAPVAAPVHDRRRKRRGLVVGLTLGGVVLLAGAGLAVGLTLGLRPDHYPASALGTIGFGR
jgi:tetratricopeptide (TPR) repeat protein